MPKYCVSLTAKNVDSCPLYERGDRIIVSMPNVDMSATDKVCSFILAELLSKRMKREKDLICEIKENFPNKQAYMSEFGITEGILYCPRVSSEVSFEILVEDPENTILDLEEFTGREDRRELVSQLKKLPILSMVSANDIFDLLSEIKVKKCNPGDIIIKKGDPGKYFYIVYKGEVEVVHPFKEGVETVIGRLNSDRKSVV